MLQRLAMVRISKSKKGKSIDDGHVQQQECLDDNPDMDDGISDDYVTVKVDMQSTKILCHYHLTYPHVDRETSDFKNRRPLSVIRLQEG